jgi:hypothetical protein
VSAAGDIREQYLKPWSEGEFRLPKLLTWGPQILIRITLNQPPAPAIRLSDVCLYVPLFQLFQFQVRFLSVHRLSRFLAENSRTVE